MGNMCKAVGKTWEPLGATESVRATQGLAEAPEGLWSLEAPKTLPLLGAAVPRPSCAKRVEGSDREANLVPVLFWFWFNVSFFFAVLVQLWFWFPWLVSTAAWFVAVWVFFVVWFWWLGLVPGGSEGFALVCTEVVAAVGGSKLGPPGLRG